MSDNDLTRQDEDLAAADLAAEDRVDGYDFGNWPEIFGLALTALLVWLTFAFTG